MTALTMTESQFKQYVQGVRSRATFAKPVHLERSQLFQQVKQIAELLKTNFGAQRLILFGSLAHQAWFTPTSDIDLAVEGLPAERYWSAWAMIETIITDREVDFIDLESASPTLRQAIEIEGIEL